MTTPVKKPTLPPKENSLFKDLVSFYETKKYKKGIKAADTILKKFPQHGETLAMKGLTLSCMGADKKQQAYDLVREGIKHDIRSHVCWHVYGLLYRGDHNYNEAIKCYRNALRNDKDNVQILRDLSVLQVHLRDIDGFRETRRQLLLLKPNNKGHWLSYAMGGHLGKEYSRALIILGEYENSITIPSSPDSSERLEYSEYFLYKASLIEESGDYATALKELLAAEKHIVDKLDFKETKARLLLQLGRNVEAETLYRELLASNPEQHDYYRQLERSLGLGREKVPLEAEQQKRAAALYDELKTTFPRADAPKRVPLDLLSGDLFRTRLDQYARAKIRKGVPSLFSDLDSLYNSQEKVDIIEELFKGYVASLSSSRTFPDSDAPESPSALLWSLFFFAQHHDKRGYTRLALDFIEQAIEHTPTAIELYSAQARFYKHAGDLATAARLTEQARKLDLADRCLANRSVKYLLRNGEIDEAVKVVGLFTKENEDAASHLEEMQCNWFQYALGRAYLRQGNYGRALKKLLSIDKHFKDFTEDQFDFHTYCLRRFTLRAYVRLLRFEDRLHSHPFFARAAKVIVRVYLDLYDNPSIKDPKQQNPELDGLSAEERRKAERKAKKAELKSKEAQQQQQQQGDKAPADKDKEKSSKPADEDPEGKLLLQADPLSEASRFVVVLKQQLPNDIDTHVLAAELYLRKRKPLLVLQALKRAAAIDADSPDLHQLKARFFNAVRESRDSLQVRESRDSLHETVKSVIDSESASLQGGLSLLEYNAAFLKRHQSSLPHRAAAADVMLSAGGSRDEALSLLRTLDDTVAIDGSRSLPIVEAIHRTIATRFGAAPADEYRRVAQRHFPLAAVFADSKPAAPAAATEDGDVAGVVEKLVKASV